MPELPAGYTGIMRVSDARLVIVAGPACSGKYPLARRLMSEDPSLVMVHRDTIRASLITLDDESLITRLMGNIASDLLDAGRSVIVCAWNMEPADGDLWNRLADKAGIRAEWLDVRDPAVAALIPPLEGWTPEALRAA